MCSHICHSFWLSASQYFMYLRPVLKYFYKIEIKAEFDLNDGWVILYLFLTMGCWLPIPKCTNGRAMIIFKQRTIPVTQCCAAIDRTKYQLNISEEYWEELFVANVYHLLKQYLNIFSIDTLKKILTKYKFLLITKKWTVTFIMWKKYEDCGSMALM